MSVLTGTAKTLEQNLKKLATSKRTRFPLFIAAFSAIGVIALLATKAATPFASIEPENSSSITPAACTRPDADASGNYSVQFGNCASNPGEVGNTNQITQYGITWTFDKAYPYGQFANGDYWVAPNNGETAVTITSMTPNAGSGLNGWMVNPSSEQQAYDDRLDVYNSSLMPALPYNATANKSIVKAVSTSGSCWDSVHTPCLNTAAVLTVLGSVPAGNGASTFRPPYFGTEKPLYTTSQLQTQLLPSLAPVGDAPTLSWVKDRFQRLQLDQSEEWSGRYLHPTENFRNGGSISNYGGALASDNNDAALRLMLNDSVSVKMPALINYTQAGIDWFYAGKGGIHLAPNGGHMMGRTLPAVFAAVMLGNQGMQDWIKNAPYGVFGDDGYIYLSSRIGRALWGRECGEGEYDYTIQSGSGPQDCRDPISMIDGGTYQGQATPGGNYQDCCTSQPFKGSSLAARLLPGGRDTWGFDPFHDYVDRWVTFGGWASPDDRNRSTSSHGINKDGGFYGSTFMKNMWNAYRNTLPPGPPL